tara:strand:+ start:1522 stop:2295 length:774 start_codon:yes stop_codon:yes gene_type:complete
MNSSIWDNFCLIKCINLKERIDRYESAKRVFDEYNIPVEFHKVDRHPDGGVVGCFTSHIEVITEAYEKGCENVLIFEDDIQVGRGYIESHFEQMFQFMNENDNWDIMFLGWHPKILTHKTIQTVIPSVWKVNAFGGHAYILSRKMIEKMAYKEWEGIAIDVYYADNDNAYALYPSVFIQRGATSDLVSNFSGSEKMKPVRAFMECWSTNINYPIYSLLKTLIVIIVLIIILKYMKLINEQNLVFLVVLFYILIYKLR